MVHDVVVEKKYPQDVADANGVDTTLVYRLVKKARLDPQYLKKQISENQR